MGFLNPAALLALPLALLPLILDRMGRRRSTSLPFSSLYLLERARRVSARRTPARAPWTALLRALAIALLVLAAARPIGPGGGSPAFHLPTRAIVAVDVSRSVAQRWEDETAWGWIASVADSILGLAGRDDEIALAAVADGVVGWWEGPADGLRRTLAALGPTGRSTNWEATLAGLTARETEGTETYLLTDGARGGREPRSPANGSEGVHRVMRVWPAPPGFNRAAADAWWAGPGWVALEARGWGEGVPRSAEAGRLIGDRLVDRRAVGLAEERAGGGGGPATWAVGDTATLALAAGDRLPEDDRIAVARGRGATYRVVRWVPADRGPEPGDLFWEAALATAARRPTTERVGTLTGIVAADGDLALLPIRRYGSDEAAVLTTLVESGTRLLFAPSCPDPACAPPPDWMPAAGPEVPPLRWDGPAPGRATSLAPRPPSTGEREAGPGVPDHVAARVAVRGGLRPVGGPGPEWTWDLVDGSPALWVRGPVAVWLVPFGPPVTRLGTTPLFPLVADAAMTRWDPAWRRRATLRAGEEIPLFDSPVAATVTGPLGDGEPRRWTVAPGGPSPRPETPGLYRIESDTAWFVAVRSVPEEGDLRAVRDEAWRAAWGVAPIRPDSWPDALFPRRRGPERTAWAVVLAISLLALAAFLRREERDDVSEELDPGERARADAPDGGEAFSPRPGA